MRCNAIGWQIDDSSKFEKQFVTRKIAFFAYLIWPLGDAKSKKKKMIIIYKKKKKMTRIHRGFNDRRFPTWNLLHQTHHVYIATVGGDRAPPGDAWAELKLNQSASR